MGSTREQLYLFMLLFFAGAFVSCIKPFIPNIEKYDELLVVDGNINDGPGPYTITLSKSSKVKEKSIFTPYTNCIVELEDNFGNKVMLTEKKPGVYKTDSLAMQGIPGRSYKLRIATSEGEWYESNPEVLLPGLKIQSVYGEVEHKNDPRYFYGRDGYQFYVDTETAPTTNNYIFWRMESTYKFRADYQISSYYDNGLHPVIDKDTFRTCYSILNIPQLYLLNTNELQQNVIKRFPLHFEDNYSKALKIRYSLKVSQFTISRDAFNYWNTIKKITDAGGELYTQQPFQMTNNLRNVTYPGKPVLGYFMAAGLSEKRIFITPVPFDFRIGKCVVEDAQHNPIFAFRDTPNLWPVFFTGTFAVPLYIDPECLDCRTKGVLVAPAYWID